MSSTDSRIERGERGERRRPADQRLERRRRPSRPGRTWRRSAGRARRAGWPARAATRSPRRASARRRRRSARGRRGTWGTARRGDTAPTWWPARPTRCSPLATLRRRLDLDHQVDRAHVDAQLEASWWPPPPAAGPALRSSSIRARCSLLTEPWWARASTGAAPVDGAGLGHHLRRVRPARRHGRRRSASPASGALPSPRRPAAPPRSRSAGRSAARPAGGSWRTPGSSGASAIEVDDALLDVRPDRGPRARPRRPARSGRR